MTYGSLTGPLAGILAGRYTFRLVTLIGAVAQGLAFVIAAFGTDPYFVSFTIGIINGKYSCSTSLGYYILGVTICIFVGKDRQAYTQTDRHKCRHTYGNTYLQMGRHTYIWIYVLVYTHTDIREYTHIHAPPPHTHTHIHTHTHTERDRDREILRSCYLR